MFLMKIHLKIELRNNLILHDNRIIIINNLDFYRRNIKMNNY